MAISITTTSLPNGVVGESYNFQLQASANPPAGLKWTCSNALPQGLTLNAASGIISGRCSASFYQSLTFYVQDLSTGSQSLPKVFTPYIGAGWSSAVIRNNLHDTGVVPRPQMPALQSPDIICTQNTTVNPSTLTQNYTSDPNKPLVPGQNNYVYVRAKNTGNTTGAGAVYLYWSPSSLMLLPSLWIGNRIALSDNLFPQTPTGSIAVTQTPFSWTPTPTPEGQGYSLISAISTIANTWNPAAVPAFSDWQSYVTWMNNIPNLCFRNVSICTDLSTALYSRSDTLSYPFATSAPMLVQVQVTNVPVRTIVAVKNDTLGLTNTQTTSSVNQSVFSYGATLPPNFSGAIQTSAQLPVGQSWPVGAQLTTTLYLGVPGSLSVNYSRLFRQHALNPWISNVMRLVGLGGQLISVGNHTTVMQ